MQRVFHVCDFLVFVFSMDSGTENLMRLSYHMLYGVHNEMRVQNSMMKTILVQQQQIMQYIAPKISPNDKARQTVNLLGRFCGNEQLQLNDGGLLQRVEELDKNISNNQQSWDDIMEHANWDEIFHQLASITDYKLSGQIFVVCDFVLVIMCDITTGQLETTVSCVWCFCVVFFWSVCSCHV